MRQGPWKCPKFPVPNLRINTQDNPILPLVNIIIVQFLVTFLSCLKKTCITFCFQAGKESNHNYIYG